MSKYSDALEVVKRELRTAPGLGHPVRGEDVERVAHRIVTKLVETGVIQSTDEAELVPTDG